MLAHPGVNVKQSHQNYLHHEHDILHIPININVSCQFRKRYLLNGIQ